MKLLVTGGFGFIGSNLIELLLKNNHDVVSLDNYSTGTEDNEHDGCHYIHGDIQDIEFWGRRLEKDDWSPDVIFHLAAEVASINFSFENPFKTLNSNVLGTLKVCDFARKNNIRVVYSSSCGVTDGSDLNLYAFSKSQAEQICKGYSDFFDLSIYFSNLFWLYLL